MNLTAIFGQAAPAGDFHYEILSFCLAAVASFFILLVYDAKNNLPGFVLFN